MWTILKQDFERRNGKLRSLVVCTCGRFATVLKGNITRGLSIECKTCGTARAKANYVPKRSPRYTKYRAIWRSMKARCLNPKNKSFVDYGMRGITIEVALLDFDTYYAYVSKLPNFNVPGYSLDRINNNGGYWRGNLQYSTHSQQMLNRRVLKK